MDNRLEEALINTWYAQFVMCDAARFDWSPWYWFREDKNYEDYEN